MTLEEAKRLLHPDTTREAIQDIESNCEGADVGKNASIKAVEQACLVACEAIDKVLASQWISVEDRLPEEMEDKSASSAWSADIRPSDDVLVYLATIQRISVAWYSHECNEWTDVEEQCCYYPEEVTHWMPLPEAPKEER